jgi:CelD/BcsL family acetyltransferase involved in cellulose biosynthesis
MLYELFEGDEGLSRIEDAWRSLESRSDCHVFQTYDYARRWQDTIGGSSGATPLVVALTENGRDVAVFPACRYRINGIPFLTWLGGPASLDYGDVLYDAESAETSVEEFVTTSLSLLGKRARGAVIYLTNVREDAHAFPALDARLRVFKRTSAPYIPIEGAWQEFIASLGRNKRKRLARRERLLSGAGVAEFRDMRHGDPDIASAMEFIITAQRERFPGPFNRTALADDKYARYRMEQAVNDPLSRMQTLFLNGTMIAAGLTVVYRNRLYCLLNSFDSDFAKLSPGAHIRAANVRACFENGWDPCDLCWGDEPDKFWWTSHATPLVTFVSNGAAGTVMTGLASGRRRIAAIMRKRRRHRSATSAL